MTRDLTQGIHLPRTTLLLIATMLLSSMSTAAAVSLGDGNVCNYVASPVCTSQNPVDLGASCGSEGNGPHADEIHSRYYSVFTADRQHRAYVSNQCQDRNPFAGGEFNLTELRVDYTDSSGHDAGVIWYSQAYDSTFGRRSEDLITVYEFGFGDDMMNVTSVPLRCPYILP